MEQKTRVIEYEGIMVAFKDMENGNVRVQVRTTDGRSLSWYDHSDTEASAYVIEKPSPRIGEQVAIYSPKKVIVTVCDTRWDSDGRLMIQDEDTKAWFRAD